MPPKDDVREEKPTYFTWRQLLVAVSVSLCSFCTGFCGAYTSPALPSMKGKDGKFLITPQQESWVGGLMPLACLVGGILGGLLIMYIGRKWTIMVTAPPFIIGWLLIGTATVIGMVLAGRAFCGLAVGLATMVLPVYLGETLHPQVRGSLGLMPTLLGNGGLLLCYAFGSFLNWYLLAFAGAVFCIPFIILMLFVPETPRYLLSRGKTEQAQKSLAWLRGKHGDIDAEMKELASTQGEKANAKSTYGDMFKKRNRKPILISLGLMLFQQLSGINVVIFYTQQIFLDAGSTIEPAIATVIVGVVNFSATLIATAVIDRIGRKVLLYISDITMIITLLTLAIYFLGKHKGWDLSGVGWLPLLAAGFYVLGFSVGFGPIPWLMMGEIMPASVRAPAASMATAFNWLCTFIVTKTFVDMISLINSYGAFSVYCVFCIIALVFVILYVPETKGKSLEQIEAELTGGKE
ncbi:facilitated trehalose transporter Tret1-like [Drosophila guanche]|uniref:Blast:Facilitated trehalose transporter Tret1 n=1 Tax=Drosophila guanche TaxID=7266 RepID=A0A3B0JJC5_DROGU|nr:facilitated trehalose transporter Tret1-like [Drosophila guanche]SPP73539.1 blast:Facilitated trehalose transporter Tret1 [Drosophila guanche]